MQSNFDKNFDSHKVTFKQKFGIEWSTNHQLYLTYLQTIYISALTEIANTGLNKVITKQEENNNLVQSVIKKLGK